MGLNGSLIVLAFLAVAVCRSGPLLPSNSPSPFGGELKDGNRTVNYSPPPPPTRLTEYGVRVRRRATSVGVSSFGALRCRLYCQNGFYLQSHLDGTVNGTKDSANKFAILEMLRVAVKLVSIRSATPGGNYVCMNRKGKMYGSRRRNAECVFVEEYLETKTFVYSSRKFSRKRRQLYIGLNRKGRARRGKRRKQRSVQFYILPVKAETEEDVDESPPYPETVNQHLEPPETDTPPDNEPPDHQTDTVETQEAD